MIISRVFNFMKQSTPIQPNNRQLFLDLLSSSSPSNSKSLHDVFINHRGADTKRNIASLLYDNLKSRNIRPFLDIKTMKPGDKLFDHIHHAILSSKVAVTVFSPNYCESYFCLHELALIMESNKRVIPIFCDIKPSELDDVMIERMTTCSDDEIKRFRWALQEATDIVGLTYDSCKGNLSDMVTVASDAIVEGLVELEAEDHENVVLSN